MWGSNLFRGRRREGGELWVSIFPGEKQRRYQGMAICDTAVTNHFGAWYSYNQTRRARHQGLSY